MANTKQSLIKRGLIYNDISGLRELDLSQFGQTWIYKYLKPTDAQIERANHNRIIMLLNANQLRMPPDAWKVIRDINERLEALEHSSPKAKWREHFWQMEK